MVWYLVRKSCCGCTLRNGALATGFILFVWSVFTFLAFIFWYSSEDRNYEIFWCNGNLDKNTTRCVMVPDDADKDTYPTGVSVLTTHDRELWNQAFLVYLKKGLILSFGCLVLSLALLAGVEFQNSLSIYAFEIYTLLMVIADVCVTCYVASILFKTGSRANFGVWIFFMVAHCLIWAAICLYCLVVVNSFRVTMVRRHEIHGHEIQPDSKYVEPKKKEPEKKEGRDTEKDN